MLDGDGKVRIALILGLYLGQLLSAAAGQDIIFKAVSVSGKPVPGQIVQRHGASKSQPLFVLDATGSKTVSDLQCTAGLQFEVEPKFPVYVGAEWQDCKYGEIRFVFNEMSYADPYRATFDQLGRFTFGNDKKLMGEAILLTNALDEKNFVQVAFAAEELQKKLRKDDPMQFGLALLEKDAIARVIGATDGVYVAPGGKIAFTAEAFTQFSAFKARSNVKFPTLSDPELGKFMAKEQFKASDWFKYGG
ncbi:hypothetical protein SAMN05444161_0454 [Rhizobiales bacterium GAS191]|nr:hypothetical protein SAMN05444161_0454 [Rhizobiales bacterium GAS191]